jgi:hypothetical protein
MKRLLPLIPLALAILWWGYRRAAVSNTRPGERMESQRVERVAPQIPFARPNAQELSNLKREFYLRHIGPTGIYPTRRPLMTDDRLRRTIEIQRERLDEAKARARQHGEAVRRYRRVATHRAPDWLTQLTARVSCGLFRDIGFHEGAIAAFTRLEEEWHG